MGDWKVYVNEYSAAIFGQMNCKSAIMCCLYIIRGPDNRAPKLPKLTCVQCKEQPVIFVYRCPSKHTQFSFKAKLKKHPWSKFKRNLTT